MGATFISKGLTTVFGFLPLKEKKKNHKFFPKRWIQNFPPAWNWLVTASDHQSFRNVGIQPDTLPPGGVTPPSQWQLRLLIRLPVQTAGFSTSQGGLRAWQCPTAGGRTCCRPSAEREGPADLGNPWGEAWGTGQSPGHTPTSQWQEVGDSAHPEPEALQQPLGEERFTLFLNQSAGYLKALLTKVKGNQN